MNKRTYPIAILTLIASSVVATSCSSSAKKPDQQEQQTVTKTTTAVPETATAQADLGAASSGRGR